MAKKIDNLFGSMRMVLPEHRTELLKHNEERDLIKRPEVDDDDFGEMCFRVYDSTQYDYAITVKWFVPTKGELGSLEEAWGVVREIDAIRKRFKLVSDWAVDWIKVEDLVSVTK
ncbi:YolD-like family protein [Brevibacillus brevis]|uniref:YolD-like family protein n=1 Tax=Brevibacillus brevis TaxID=1393 RepID=A0A517IAB7_BREBE|nr:YolD-like family protein [Brevibacillus brevis]QDS35815.1 YolD-like family protein [Brevibacillus brevis]